MNVVYLISFETELSNKLKYSILKKVWTEIDGDDEHKIDACISCGHILWAIKLPMKYH